MLYTNYGESTLYAQLLVAGKHGCYQRKRKQCCHLQRKQLKAECTFATLIFQHVSRKCMHLLILYAAESTVKQTGGQLTDLK